MSPARRGVLCAGRAYCDLVFSRLDRLPTLGTETFAGALGVHAGGGACITAAWLASLGRSATLCATLPAAPFDAAFVAEARACGVGLDACVPSTDAEPQITAAMVSDGDRGFLTRKVGPALPADHERHFLRADIGHLHVSELGTLLEYPGLARAARRAGLSVSLDCAWDDAALARTDLSSLLVDVDVFLPNESEAGALAGCGNALSDVPLVVIKRGAAGAVAHVGGNAAGDERTSVERRGETVDALDPTGAGDAFDAGFLHAWLDGAPLAACLDLGNACGARAVSRAGGATACLADAT